MRKELEKIFFKSLIEVIINEIIIANVLLI